MLDLAQDQEDYLKPKKKQRKMKDGSLVGQTVQPPESPTHKYLGCLMKTMTVCFAIDCLATVFHLVAFGLDCEDNLSSNCGNAQTLDTLATLLKIISCIILIMFAFKNGPNTRKKCIVYALILQIVSSFL